MDEGAETGTNGAGPLKKISEMGDHSVCHSCGLEVDAEDRGVAEQPTHRDRGAWLTEAYVGEHLVELPEQRIRTAPERLPCIVDGEKIPDPRRDRERNPGKRPGGSRGCVAADRLSEANPHFLGRVGCDALRSVGKTGI